MNDEHNRLKRIRQEVEDRASITTILSQSDERQLRRIVDKLEDNGMYADSRRVESICDRAGHAE